MASFSLLRDGRICVLSVSGNLDHEDMDGLSNQIALATATKQVDALIVDLSDLWRIGSRGMRALSIAHTQLMKQGQQMIVAGLTGDVRETFAISGIDELLHLTDDVPDARALCRTERMNSRRAAE